MPKVDKATIVRAAEAVVRERGARKLTLDAVAAHCGLSKGGLIHHFPTKQSLIKAMLQAAVDREYASTEASVASGAGLLIARLNAIFELMEDDESLPRSLIAAVAENPALLDPFKAKQAALRSELAKIYRDPELALLLILAAQGMFLGRVLGVLEIEDPLFERLRERLLMLSTDLA
ncbi:TetR/AcrR family transcriptional regulator [Microbulbifer sp. 2304DJ12-6]|uniref:TetR/AcrR family transcriptional regulator n=1 Tax=Microbulbifer sp. 2304DJ12-6 TaxID=3233340 RepID=UPI0026251033|nr:TetR/AcrR family transcriptional regulator [uncultured Microbulbifer sp.]